MEEKLIKDAQYRKGLSIAFFNATNSAVALVATMGIPSEGLLEEVIRIRDIFLNEHKTYYATVIANVGANYKAEDSIAKLKATNTLEDLQTAWRLLSADERKDGEIIKCAKELKAKHNEK